MRWLLVFALVVQAAFGCAVAPPPGLSARIAGEDVLIVWDAEHKTEHLIRRAYFHGDAKDFGFLVPTPTQPRLGEAPDEVFGRLVGEIRPRQKTWEIRSLLGDLFMLFFSLKARGISSSRGLQVLDTRNVGGYEAAVLKASDPAELSAWLKKNGYPSSPDLQAWVEPYLRKGWILTAFKIANPEADVAPEVGTKAVWMTFASEQPFFPYSEPKTESEFYHRKFRLYFVAGERYGGRLEDGTSWPNDVLYSQRISDPDALLAGCPASPSKAWLTAFYDSSGVRPAGGDLLFGPVPSDVVQAPPVSGPRTIPVYVELVLLALFVVWRVRRKKPP